MSYWQWKIQQDRFGRWHVVMAGHSFASFDTYEEAANSLDAVIE